MSTREAFTMLRRSLATATAVVALALPLSSCGFEYATQRDYTPGAGTNSREADVDVLSAVVVSGAEGKGTLVASLSNDLDKAQQLVGVTGKRVSTNSEVKETPVEVAVTPIEIGPHKIVNLATAEDVTPITVVGDFRAGNVLSLDFSFDSGESVTLEVPVVANDKGDWKGLDKS
jgi:copper(I)-binding protein